MLNLNISFYVIAIKKSIVGKTSHKLIFCTHFAIKKYLNYEIKKGEGTVYIIKAIRY